MRSLGVPFCWCSGPLHFRRALRRWRHPAGFLILSIALGTATVSLQVEADDQCGLPPIPRRVGDRGTLCRPVFTAARLAAPGAMFSRRTFILGLCTVRALLPLSGAYLAGTCALCRRHICLRPGSAGRTFPVARHLERSYRVVCLPWHFSFGYRGEVWKPGAVDIQLIRCETYPHEQPDLQKQRRIAPYRAGCGYSLAGLRAALIHEAAPGKSWPWACH